MLKKLLIRYTLIIENEMSTLVILILLIIAALLIYFRIRIGLIILVFAIFCFIGIGTGLIPAIFLDQLQKPFLNLPKPQWKNNNAIILLGVGVIKLPSKAIHPTIMAYSRINEAARLYFDCIKSHNRCKVIISGGDVHNVGNTEAAIYRSVLNELGVNHSDIILESKSLNTYQNAEFTSRLLQTNRFDEIFLVTSAIHLKRALLYFAHFGIIAKPAVADYLTSQIGILPLGYNFAMMDFATHEYMGILRFHIYNFLGWNADVSSNANSR
jgi:uncharacterized SAM-binding protein YcdF (DUF218 family)